MKYLDKRSLSIIFIILFHIVGVLGFIFANKNAVFMDLVPFHILLMTGILIANRVDYNKSFFKLFFGIIISTIVIEIIGVKTGLIFGNYSYGKTLGYKVFGVPLVIGLNWVTLVLCVGSILKKQFKHQRLIKSLIGAAIITGVDFLIEPVAMHFDYWNWQNGVVPLQNYVAWFILSFILLRIYYAVMSSTTNKVALPLLLSQVAFFIALNLAIR